MMRAQPRGVNGVGAKYLSPVPDCLDLARTFFFAQAQIGAESSVSGFCVRDFVSVFCVAGFCVDGQWLGA